MNKIIMLQAKIGYLATSIWGPNYVNPLIDFCRDYDIELSHTTKQLCKKIIKLLEEKKNNE